MHLNPAYLLFALLSPVAYAAPTTAVGSNLSRRGQLLDDNTVHVNISGDPLRTYRSFNKNDHEYLQPRLETIFQYWISSMEMFKLSKEGKKISRDMIVPPDLLKPLNIVIEKESVPELEHFRFTFWGSGVKEIPGFQGCELEGDRCGGYASKWIVFFNRNGEDMYYANRNKTGFGAPVEAWRISK
ncbi:hypothetical protein GGU10DRAFT_370282 [Lentinula aff. detonsa]|uniref:Uncharacterized protein n=1 Tax=Lentinula aff. detonsa TaxID=2804958 RepID=A0AA38KW35_9AGAR|nr:hypothetical protein GGU10DRAFT_370282 [Lentinula aff. detonsa]